MRVAAYFRKKGNRYVATKFSLFKMKIMPSIRDLNVVTVHELYHLLLVAIKEGYEAAAE